MSAATSMARVLVIEDSMYAREMLVAALAQGGYAIAGQAATATDGLAMFSTVRPDLTILDLSLPDGDGFATLTEIQQIDPYARVIIHTAHARRENVLASIQAGAADILVKPVPLGRLLASVRDVLAHDPRQAPRELPEAEKRDLLQATLVAQFATIDASGHPRIAPHPFLWSGGRFHVACTRTCNHARDLDLRAEASLSITKTEDTSDDGQPRGYHLHASGHARVDNDQPRYWARRIAEKYTDPTDDRRQLWPLANVVAIEFVPMTAVATSAPVLPVPPGSRTRG